MLVSVALSIHNRSRLLARALAGYAAQSMPARDFEIILVDDQSTEDLSKVLEPWRGKLNIVHVRIDHTRHPSFRARNPEWKAGDAFENWFHTPAISTNVGISMARGKVLCLCHPEILHAPWNLERAWTILEGGEKQRYLFGLTYLGTQTMNALLDADPDWTRHTWPVFIDRMGGAEVPRFRSNELYWYTSFLPKVAAKIVRGVDFRYLDGVAGEDDDFKHRVETAGWRPVFESRVEGFHQDHTNETERHRRRDTPEWESALARNRAILDLRRKEKFLPFEANAGTDWTAMDTVVSIDKLLIE